MRETYLNAVEVANILGISLGSVYNKAKKGTIPSYRMGRRWLFKPDDIEKISGEYTPVPYSPPNVQGGVK